MPIFEYRCTGCGSRFETLVRGAERPACPSCGSRSLDKQLSVFAVGGHAERAASAERAGACGTCGDPRGPGACSLD